MTKKIRTQHIVMATSITITFHDTVENSLQAISFPLVCGQQISVTSAIERYGKETGRCDVGALLGHKKDGTIGIMKGEEIVSDGRYILLGHFLGY